MWIGCHGFLEPCLVNPKLLPVLILTTAALTVLSIWLSTSGLLRPSTAGGGCHHVMSLWVQGTLFICSFTTVFLHGLLHWSWVLFLAGVANTLLWPTEMPSMSLEETMGEYLFSLTFPANTQKDLIWLVISFSKNMLNDLLRFDVKDCSWCRWVLYESLKVNVLKYVWCSLLHWFVIK